jgi:hypothetical protein
MIVILRGAKRDPGTQNNLGLGFWTFGLSPRVTDY